MKHLTTLSLTALLLVGCAATLDTFGKTTGDAFGVTAAFETPVVDSVGDSADDPAIYIGENGAGFIAATDKQAGLYIYNLDGTQRQFIDLGLINNVDLREGFSYKGEDHVLLVASDDETNAIVTLLYNPSTDMFVMPAESKVSTTPLSPYGICLGKSASGEFNVGLTTKAGVYEQHVITVSDDKMVSKMTHTFSTGTKTEGCAFDDRTGKVYIAEEGAGFYQYPSFGDDLTRTVISKARSYGMRPDLEGVTLYETGTDGGYAIVSSQGNNSYGAFRLPGLEFAGRFTIEDGIVDGVSTTDGIAVTSKSTERFPKGFLVVQDDMDDISPSQKLKKQNFKIIDWRDIEAGFKVP